MEDNERQTEKILLEPMGPIVQDTEGLDKEKTIKGMKHEMASSLEVVVIVSPFFVLTVVAEMRCRCVSGSVSGLSKLTRAAVVRVCLVVLPSSSSPVNARFFGGAKGSAACDGRAACGGIGSAGRCCAVEGDVANGTSVIGPPFVDLGCFSACGVAAGS